MWNPVAPETIENPFPFWAWLRKEAPVWEVSDAGYYTIRRYSDLIEVSRALYEGTRSGNLTGESTQFF
jgi:hypothetical protein